MKLLSTLFILAAVYFPQLILAQNAPAIDWQKSIGGTNEDESSAIRQTNDGGFIVAGDSYSSDHDVTSNHGASDYWIVKIDDAGNILWQKSFGGSSNDVASDIRQTFDGGYIVAGFSRSNDGDVTDHHGTTSYNDYWVVKLDTGGTIEWQKSLGGTANEYANSIQQTADSGYVIGGYSTSNDGDVTAHHGAIGTSDYWIVKLNATGDILWQKSLGGNSSDNANSIQQTTDHGFIVAGSTSSNDNDVSGNHGFTDYWIVKLDSAGDIDWQKCLGGSGDETAAAVQQTTDGGFIVAGWSNSDDNDVSGNHGNYDYWIAKLSADGNLDWQKSYGGATGDFANSIEQTSDSGFIVAGYTSSNNGNVTGYHGGVFFGDYWIVKLDADGNLVWQKCLGGTNDDYAASVQETDNGGFIIAGWTESSDGDVTSNYGSADVWIVQLEVPTSIDEINSTSSLSLTPNPVSQVINLSLQLGENENTKATIAITNMLGEEIFSKESSIMNGSLEEAISLDGKIPGGMYLVKINFNSQQIVRPLFVVR